MEISAGLVKELRDKTSAGILDCRNALIKSNGDIEAAFDYLRKQGIAKADTKSGKAANEGAVLSYIHPGKKLGVLLELNCETDFVAKTDDFLQLAKELSMQIAASNPLSVTREGLPEELTLKEREIISESKDLEGKPENIVEKIIEGKIEKWYQQVCLIEQAYIKDPSKTVSDLIKESINILGENINVSRFMRFQLGDNSQN